MTSFYQQDHSHTHCFVAQEEHKKHLACCICRKKNQINALESSPYQKLKKDRNMNNCSHCYCKKSKDLSHKICCNCKNKQIIAIHIPKNYAQSFRYQKPPRNEVKEFSDAFRARHHRNPTGLELWGNL